MAARGRQPSNPSGQRPDKSDRFRRELSDANGTPPGQWRQGALASIDLLTGAAWSGRQLQRCHHSSGKGRRSRGMDCAAGGSQPRRPWPSALRRATLRRAALISPRPGPGAGRDARSCVARSGRAARASRYKYLKWAAPVAVHAAVIRQLLYFHVRKMMGRTGVPLRFAAQQRGPQAQTWGCARASGPVIGAPSRRSADSRRERNL